jgi:hypothetical protein
MKFSCSIFVPFGVTVCSIEDCSILDGYCTSSTKMYGVAKLGKASTRPRQKIVHEQLVIYDL